MTNEKMVCDCCSDWCPDTATAFHAGWEWFTGYLPKRFVVCCKCLADENQRSYIASQREISQTRPTPAAHRPTRSSLIVLP